VWSRYRVVAVCGHPPAPLIWSQSSSPNRWNACSSMGRPVEDPAVSFEPARALAAWSTRLQRIIAACRYQHHRIRRCGCCLLQPEGFHVARDGQNFSKRLPIGVGASSGVCPAYQRTGIALLQMAGPYPRPPRLCIKPRTSTPQSRSGASWCGMGSLNRLALVLDVMEPGRRVVDRAVHHARRSAPTTPATRASVVG
jgi:hypothetical protein